MSSNNSSSIGTGLTSDDPAFWSQPTPIDCTTVRIIGILLCVATLVGIFLNGALLISFIRHKELRTPPNIFIMFISFIGLIASSVNLPLTGSSSVFCHWLYSRQGCQLEGLTAFLYGCSSCYLLCTVSISRCYIIIRPFNAKSVTVKKSVVTCCIAILIALLWTILPLVGWNEYTLERSRTSCCTNLYDRRRLFVSFNIFIFVVVYCVPLIILLITNSIIYRGIKGMRKKVAQGVKTELSQKRIEMERRVLKTVVITVVGFLFTWTPYAITFFISAFGAPEANVSPMATFICACFAKTSMIWIPTLYMSTSTQFRFSLVDKSSLEKLGGVSTTGGDGPNVAAITRGKADNLTATGINANKND
ncbi:unnamed protein product [Adineta ricciae]|uniref:G-protein coupled receptors family 1 profile domain-containing protein n=1 Tax=Adineta ricciae TaxID=249248 RepID=A0A815ZQS3_ADIRI|nr:unnamed protein product [Adineta ricciae]CAF1587361.1 unnamed protein product [Adineta ricciae]